MTIETILKASYPSVLTLLRAGHTFVSPELRAAQADGRVTIQQGDNDGRGIALPLVWSLSDDQQSVNDQIRLVTHLIENAVQCHDDLFLHTLGSGTATVSQGHCYDLTNDGPFSALLSTSVEFST